MKSAIRQNTRIVWIETPTNPLMVLTDISGSRADARAIGGAEVVVDNTFMSPYFQRPIEFGADMVMHSTTKFLNGHSDGLGGVVAGHQTGTRRKLGIHAESLGRDSVALRMLAGAARREDAGRAHGKARRERPQRWRSFSPQSQEGEARCFYPGLADHPQHALAKRQMTGFGSMITFETGSLGNAKKMLKKVTRLLAGRIAGRRGNADLASRDHDPRGARRKGSQRIGITDGMVRISVGIEDVDDLLDDLDQALAAI